LNPAPFVAYLNNYITGLRDKIAYVRFGTRPPKELNISNLYQALDKNGIAFPKIVVAQALLETGYFTSNVCLNYNNLFGLRKPNEGSYYRFNNWEESVKAYKDYVQYKYKGGDYFRFLQRIGYAEDPNYLYKVKSISGSL
jgi:flagellum-specific peptidoglycan hydrolase FlgJ